MSTPVRTLVDIALRSVALLVLVEGVAELYAATNSDDDGLATGLTAMFALAYAAAMWGLWAGFHRRPVPLCVTWVVTGLVVSIGSTVYSHLRFGEWSWSVLADDLRGGLVFWAGLVAVPAIVCGIVQSLSRRRTDALVEAQRG
jgi:hypothetical protein